MNQSDTEILADLLQELIAEKEVLQDRVRSNLDGIRKIDIYIESLLEKEDINFKVFSPRAVASKYQDEIVQKKEEKISYEEKNREYTRRIDKLEQHIERLEAVLKQNENEPSVSEREIEERNKNLALLSIQEQERQRIARDLHDTSLQNLAHLVHKIELSSMYIDQDSLRAKLELAVISKNLKAVIEEIRNTIFDLRPMTFDDLGMKDALIRLLEKMNEQHQFEIIYDIDDIACDNNLVLVTLFRVAKECISNAVKHSNGKRLYFSCKEEGNFCCMNIEDDGEGFTMDEVEEKMDKHFGLSVIKERVELLGGRIEYISQAGNGTKIYIRVPIN